MKRLKNYILLFFLLAGIFSAQNMHSQETKKHKRMWWRFGLKKHRDTYNPYVKHGKSTHAISREQKKEDDKALKRAKKEYKKGIRRSARKRKKG
ncbi:MAG TPA: hypothetical protein VNZ49_00595 [Bacteroidia bacterium]|jgi:hypothetical protein|nr:hypothetical protein [Bacteroidia bacterium]